MRNVSSFEAWVKFLDSLKTGGGIIQASTKAQGRKTFGFFVVVCCFCQYWGLCLLGRHSVLEPCHQDLFFEDSEEFPSDNSLVPTPWFEIQRYHTHP